jgi:hypothetical protein
MEQNKKNDKEIAIAPRIFECEFKFLDARHHVQRDRRIAFGSG